MHLSIWECSSLEQLHKSSSILLKLGKQRCAKTGDCVNPLCRNFCQINFCFSLTIGSLRELREYEVRTSAFIIEGSGV